MPRRLVLENASFIDHYCLGKYSFSVNNCLLGWVGWVGFYGVSTVAGYLMPNPEH